MRVYDSEGPQVGHERIRGYGRLGSVRGCYSEGSAGMLREDPRVRFGRVCRYHSGGFAGMTREDPQVQLERIRKYDTIGSTNTTRKGL
jgi:hypothetical protein